MRRAWEALLALLYPRRAVCMGCGSAAGNREDWVCASCREQMASQWVGAERPVRGVDGFACCYAYHGPVAGVVRRMKYSGVRQLAAFMGEDMARAYRSIEGVGADCVTCVPMHRKRLRRRGYNHAELLAREVAARTGLPYAELIERVRNTRQQARLDDEARRNNLRDAFAARQSLAGRRVVLVDDVCTTGATARGCAEALRAAGAAQVFLLCYARAGKRKR